MSFLWFLIAVTFSILWFQARSSSDESTDDDRGYGQGYWDGYRAFGDKVTALLAQDAANETELRALVSEGRGTQQPEMQEMVGIISDDEATESDDTSTTRPAVVAEAPVAAQPVLTPEEIALEEEQRTLKNLNLLLYIGSFLIVAAAALFVTLVMPASVKLGSLVLVTAAFYVSGLVIYANSSRLKPAAVAFVGTGLAILPFVGFALTLLGGMSGEAAWLVTSLLGLVAYGLAAIRLQSELISYLTMAFVVSLALSAVSTLELAMVWYFIVVIGVSLVCSSVHFLWPKLVPEIFSQPVEQTGHLATPVALVASLFVMNRMELYMYEVLYGVATAHYLVVWLERKTLLYEVLVRVLAQVTLLVIALDISHFSMYSDSKNQLEFGMWFLGIAVAQAVYSLVRVRRRNPESLQVEQAFLGVSLVFVILGMGWWSGVEQADRWVSLSLVVAGAISAGATLRLKQADWSYVGLAASLVLPFVVGRSVFDPKLSYEVLAGGFTVAGLFALMVLERVRSTGRSQAVQALFTVATAVYALLIALSGYLSGEDATVGWTTLLTGGLFAALSYLLRATALEMVGAVAGLASVAAWVSAADVDESWRTLVVVVVTTVFAIAAAFMHHARQERDRRDSLTAFGAVIFACLVFVAMGDEVVVRTATALLAAGGVVAVGLRFALGERKSNLRTIAQVAYIGLPAAALITSLSAGGAGWVALALAVGTLILWLCSYVEKLPAVLLAGNLVFVGTLAILWSWLDFATDWQTYGVAWLSAAVFYAAYWLMVDKGDTRRQWASLVSVWIVLGFATVASIFDGSTTWVMAAAGSLVAGAATLAVQGYIGKSQDYQEIAVYIATFGLQRMVSVLLPETNIVVYGHWWALVIGLMALWRTGSYRVRAMVALGFVTASTGIYALTGVEGYPLMFLIEHLVIVAVGAVFRQQWALWWGIVAVVVAVLYFLRGYTFLALLFLGFLLIVFVIWRLSKTGNK